jgi:hypothetical protein
MRRSCEVEVNGRGTNDNGPGALPLSYAGIIPAAGFEPAPSRSLGEVTLVFTTGRNNSAAASLPTPLVWDEVRVARASRARGHTDLALIRSGNMRAGMVLYTEDLHLLALRLRSIRVLHH